MFSVCERDPWSLPAMLVEKGGVFFWAVQVSSGMDLWARSGDCSHVESCCERERESITWHEDQLCRYDANIVEYIHYDN